MMDYGTGFGSQTEVSHTRQDPQKITSTKKEGAAFRDSSGFLPLAVPG